MVPSTLPSITGLFLCFFLYLASGAWVAQLLFPGPRNLRWWTYALVLGLGGVTLTVANLNYLGLPVSIGAPASVGLHLGLSIYFFWRNRRPILEIENQELGTLAIGLLGVVLFATPYWATGAYPFFGDSYSNCAVADFVRDQGYHSSPEPIHEQIWKTQMWSFFNGHFRMGVPYVLATISAFLGVKAYWAYVGVCCFLLAVAILSFTVLAGLVFSSLLTKRLAIGAFACNLMMVHWALASGFLPQTIGLGIAFLLITTGLELGRGNRSHMLAFGILLAMQIAFYPEVLPFILAPVLAAVFVDRFREGIPAVTAAALDFARAGLVVVLVNGYNVYYAALGYVAVFKGRPMNKIGLGLENYFTMFFGLSSIEAVSPFVRAVAITLSLILAAVCVFGWTSLRGASRSFVWSSLLICAPVGIWMGLGGSEYSLYKVTLYLFYLVPLGTVAGLATLASWKKELRLVVRLFTLAWILVSGFVYAGYMRNAYGVLAGSVYRSGAGDPAQYMREFSSLEGLEQVAAPPAKTLLLLPATLPATWASYFFRAPSYQYFRGVYSEMLQERPAPSLQSFSHILTEKARSGWAPKSTAIFENNRYSLITVQPVVTVTGEGWYETEYLGADPVHWMKDTGELLAFAPSATTIALEADSMLGPHGKPRLVSIFVDGKPAGTFTAPIGKGRVQTPAMTIPAGFSKIELRSEGTTSPQGADTRLLNILFGRWSLSTDGVGAPPPAATSSLPLPLSFTIRGATEDQWITPAGAALVPSGSNPYRRLRLQIEVPGVPTLLPLNVKSTGANGFNYTWSISKPGRYDMVVELPTPVTGELQLMPDKHFVPRDVGANSDIRRLSFRILSCTPVP